MITRIDPIVVFVRDFEKSLAFYRDQVGLKLAYPPMKEGQGWAAFQVGGTGFCIHGGGKGNNRKSPVDVHFSVKDIRGTARKMKAKGVTCLHPVKKMPWGLETTFRDPSGNTFELLEPARRR